MNVAPYVERVKPREARPVDEEAGRPGVTPGRPLLRVVRAFFLLLVAGRGAPAGVGDGLVHRQPVRGHGVRGVFLRRTPPGGRQ